MDDDRTLSDKLSGRFRHPEDAGGKTILAGRLLRSPRGHGRISVLDLPETPEGIVSLVSSDIPGNTRIMLGGVSVPVLSGRDILWEGQPILAAAGPDADTLDNWLSSIKMEFADNKAGLDGSTANPGHYRRNSGEPDTSFARAFQVVEEIFSVPSHHPRGNARTVSCIRDGSSYILHAATSWPGAIRRTVSRALKTDKSNIRVRPYPADGGTSIWQPALDATQAGLLSRAARKSVRLHVSAEESRLWDPCLPACEFRIRGAVDGEGRILAMEVDFTLTTGALFPLENEFLDRMVMGLFSIYPCRNYRVEGKIIRERTTPSSHGPAIGFELGFLAGELFASRVAEHSLLPPGNWRKESMPSSGQPFGPGITLPRYFPLPDILSRTIGISDFERKHASYEQTRLNRRDQEYRPEEHRGIGISCGWFGNGFAASARELGAAAVNITLDKEGILSIDVPAHTAGPAMTRAWSMMAGEILGIESSAVRFPIELSPGAMEPGPSILGRNASVYSKLIELACNDLSRRRFRDALPITVSRSRRRSARVPWSAEDFEGTAFESLTWGSAAVEVAVTVGTGLPRVSRIWIVIEAGRLMMPEHARNSVAASVENALRWSLGNTDFPEAPLVDIQFISGQGKKSGPKDVSTIPWLIIPAACVQAVRQATGSEIDSIPISRGGGLTGGCL